MKITDEIAMLKNTHLMDWLEHGYIHCANGQQDWCEGYLNSAHDYILALEAAVAAVPEPAMRRVRHKKRGSTYAVLGVAELQIACSPIFEGSKLTIYRCEEDGKLWARDQIEFNDGRFEELPVAPALDAGKPVAWVRSKFGDPEAFGERVIEADEKAVQKLPYNTPLYAALNAEGK